MRSVCVIRTTVGQHNVNISTDTERRAGLSAIAELLVIYDMFIHVFKYLRCCVPELNEPNWLAK